MSTDPHVFMLILVPKYDIYQRWQWKFFFILFPPPRCDYKIIYKLLRGLHIGRVGRAFSYFSLLFCVFTKIFSAGPYSGLRSFFSSPDTVLPLLVGIEAQR